MNQDSNSTDEKHLKRCMEDPIYFIENHVTNKHESQGNVYSESFIWDSDIILFDPYEYQGIFMSIVAHQMVKMAFPPDVITSVVAQPFEKLVEYFKENIEPKMDPRFPTTLFVEDPEEYDRMRNKLALKHDD